MRWRDWMKRQMIGGTHGGESVMLCSGDRGDAFTAAIERD